KTGGATQPGPVAVAFQAVDELTGLYIIANLTADHAAVDVETRWQAIPFRPAEAITAVDTEIEAGPIVGRRYNGSPRRGRAGGADAAPGLLRMWFRPSPLERAPQPT